MTRARSIRIATILPFATAVLLALSERVLLVGETGIPREIVSRRTGTRPALQNGAPYARGVPAVLDPGTGYPSLIASPLADGQFRDRDCIRAVSAAPRLGE